MSEEHDNTVHPQPVAMSHKPKKEIWKYFLYVLVAGLVISAIIAVVAILIGEFNGTIGKALGTTVLIMIHAMIGLAFMQIDTEKPGTSQIILYTLFGIVVGSMLVSSLSTWDVINSNFTMHAYQWFFLALFSAALAQILLYATRKDTTTRLLTFSSIGLDILILVLLTPVIFLERSMLPDVYFRLIAATGVLLGTSATLTAIFHVVYKTKHPETHATSHSTSTFMIVMWVLLGLLAVYVLPWFLFGILMQSSYGY